VTAYAERARQWLRRHARAIGMIAQLFALVLVIWFLVVPQLHGSIGSLHLLFHVGNSWIRLALAAELASLGFYTLVTRAMLPRETRPRINRVMRIDLSAIALGHCLPDGGAAGTALSWRLLISEGVPAPEAAFAKVAQGLGSAVVLQALLLASYGLGSVTSGLSQWEVLPAVASASILMLAALIVSGARRIHFRRGVGRIVFRVPWCGPRLVHLLAGIYRRHLVEQLRSTVHDRRAALLAVSWAAANWAFDALALWASLRAYGSNVGLEALAVVFGVQAFAAWLPITPSGLGISEAVMIPALIAFGSPRTAAILGVLTWRLIAYWLPIPIGALAFGSLRVFGRSVAKKASPAETAGQPESSLVEAPQSESVPCATDSHLQVAAPLNGPGTAIRPVIRV
jgi:uncharacterized protein (TIRG00374 family)